MTRKLLKIIQVAVCFVLVLATALASTAVLDGSLSGLVPFSFKPNAAGSSDLLAVGKSILAEASRKGDFIYGVNVPWVAIGEDFGSDASQLLNDSSAKPDYRPESYEKIFTNCKAIGYNGIRLWLLTSAQGIRFTEYGDVLGLDDYFLKNLKNTLQLAKKYDMPLDITLQPRMNYAYDHGTKHEYDVLTQFIVNPKYRKNYLEKVVVPICELLKGYKDIVLSVTVYAGPESDIYSEKNHLYGTDWQTVKSFIVDSCKTVRKALPDMPISVSAELDDYTSMDYMDVDVDVLGVNIYNNSGEVANPKTINSDKAMWIGECGPDTTYNTNNSNEFHTELMMNFYQNAKDNGYLGAFWWAYNYVLPFSMIFAPEDYSTLRPAAVVLHNYLLDEQYYANGIEPDSVADKPYMLYSDDPVFIKWIGCRDPESYTIEHSLDGKKFSVLEADIDPDKVTDEHGICSYSLENVKKANCDYTYRIKVKTFGGYTAVSDTATYYFPKVMVPEDENVVKNPKFETGDLTDWKVTGTVKIIDSSTSDNYQISGYSARLATGASIGQTIAVTPNTRFIFSMRLRTTSLADNAKLCIYGGKSGNELLYEFKSSGIQTWNQTVTKLFDDFETGENETLRFEITNLAGNILVVDDVAFGVG